MNAGTWPGVGVWFVVLLTVVGLSGCQTEKPDYSNLALDHRHFQPANFVNFTAEDLPHYPALQELLLKWESWNGTYGGFNKQYPYEKGMAIVRDLQARRPDVQWPIPNVVTISYKGTFFDVTASPPVS